MSQIILKKILGNAKHFSALLKQNEIKIIKILCGYESMQVARDEFNRSIDVLENLAENKSYFGKIIGGVGVFLPKNQPLYAFCCFAVIPSYQSERVSVWTPVVMRSVMKDLLVAIDQKSIYPNIHVCVHEENRSEFLQK
jgi:lysyl-tRNA synthetase class 1